MQTRASMRKFSCEHMYQVKKLCSRTSFQLTRIAFLRVGQTNVLRHDFVCEKMHTEKGL